jgi:hypothetical protein
MFSLTQSPNPDDGVQISSAYANYSDSVDPNGGGTGTFNGQDEPLTAPMSGTFYITAVPENAASGPDYTNGVLLYATVTVQVF